MHTVLQEDYILKQQEIFAQSVSLLYQSSSEVLVKLYLKKWKIKVSLFISLKFYTKKIRLLKTYLDPYYFQQKIF